MPAIQLERLHKQTAELAQSFNEPTTFAKKFHDLLEFYADRTRRPGLETASAPLTHAYNAPAPVLQRVLFVVSSLATDDPVRALLLADTCWQEETFEFRLFSARLLGLLPDESASSILERLPTWVNENREPEITETLANKSLSSIYANHPAYLLPQIEEWLVSSLAREQIFGLLALTELLKNQKFDNLPVIFRILKPRMSTSQSSVRPYIIDVIHALAQKSAPETSFYLQNILNTEADDGSIRWVIRHSLESFPTNTQAKFRQLLRK